VFRVLRLSNAALCIAIALRNSSPAAGPTEMWGLTTMAWYGVSRGFAAAVVLLAVAFLRRRVAACDALYNDKHPSPVPGPLVLRSVDAPVHPPSASVGERRVTPRLEEMPC